MHGLKQLVYDNQPFFSLNQTGKTNRELYILWKQNKRDDIFLLLYTQLWMALEEVYMENVIDYYKKDCYEKKYQNTITDRLFLCNHGIFIFLK